MNKRPESIPHSRPWISQTDHSAVNEVLASHMIAKGELCAKFEDALVGYSGQKYGVLQSSGTAGLVLALRAIGVNVGQSVVLPTYVCRNVLDAVLSIGAIPQLCDVDKYGLVTPETVERVFTNQTKAIIAVHTFGNSCDVASLNSFNVPIIADACQGLGLVERTNDQRNFGDVQVLSFHATKCITTGEGGMVLTSNDRIADSARTLSQFSAHPQERLTSSMSDLQAALGLAQIVRFSDFESRRSELFSRYLKMTNTLGLRINISPTVKFPFRFVIRANTGFVHMARKFVPQGVQVRRGVDGLLHRLLGLDDSSFPMSVELFNSNLSLPFYPSLSDDEVARVLDALEFNCNNQ